VAVAEAELDFWAALAWRYPSNSLFADYFGPCWP